jgi:hypothetical protein
MSLPSKTKLVAIDAILKHASKKGVTIFLDGDGVSETAILGDKYDFDEQEKVLTIVISYLTEEEQDQLLPVISEYFDKHELVLTSEQEQILEDYISYNDSNPYEDTINFFQGKIPPGDLNALKMSFYMKIKMENKESIEKYKMQIRDRFGARGAYIANLCSAGFFEDLFRKLALKLSPERFSQIYEQKVGQELAALFVHTGMNMTAVINGFQEKVRGCLLNGVFHFKVLGFGKKNVELIIEFVELHGEKDWGVDLKLEKRLYAPNTAIEYEVVLP